MMLKTADPSCMSMRCVCNMKAVQAIAHDHRWLQQQMQQYIQGRKGVGHVRGMRCKFGM